MVNESKSIGYVFADESLTNESDAQFPIQFILGAKSFYCVPETDVVFGDSNNPYRSVYSVTPHGILLKGEIDQVLRDLPYLSEKANLENSCTVTNELGTPVIDSGVRKLCLASNVLENQKLKNNTFAILDKEGNVIDSKLEEAVSQVFNSSNDLNFPKASEEKFQVNETLISYSLENLKRSESGRIIMPILWNSRTSHLLGQNYNLSRAILRNVYCMTLSKNDGSLEQMDEVF